MRSAESVAVAVLPASAAPAVERAAEAVAVTDRATAAGEAGEPTLAPGKQVFLGTRGCADRAHGFFGGGGDAGTGAAGGAGGEGGGQN